MKVALSAAGLALLATRTLAAEQMVDSVSGMLTTCTQVRLLTYGPVQNWQQIRTTKDRLLGRRRWLSTWPAAHRNHLRVQPVRQSLCS
eukprot:SAG31_NODE_2057_length_6542_cov_2.889182_3_plen_88_part_00